MGSPTRGWPTGRAAVEVRADFLALMALLAFGCAGAERTAQPGVETMQTMNVRPPKDLVGFTHTAEGIERVVARALEAERERIAENGPRATRTLSGMP